MLPETVSVLLDLNRQFYQQFGRAFAVTRQRLQPGVIRLLGQLPLEGRWLDLGCGNGELAKELGRRGFRGEYVGLDFSKELLKEARKGALAGQGRPLPLTPSPRSGEGGKTNISLRRFSTPKVPPVLWERLRQVVREMRHEPTEAENLLWQRLRTHQLLDLKFKRQHPLDFFILDFYCPEIGLVIEVDGSVHQYSQEEDALRTEFLQARGLTVVRFTNQQVLAAMPQVLRDIETTAHLLLEHNPGVSSAFSIPSQRIKQEADFLREHNPEASLPTAPHPHPVGRGSGGEVDRVPGRNSMPGVFLPEFQLADLSNPSWSDSFPPASFDTILSFAALHHLPGVDLRRAVLAQVRRLLPDGGGTFIHSEWQFQHSPRLLARVQPWEKIDLGPALVEEGDYLMDWRYALPGQPAESTGLRYVHLFSLGELFGLAGDCGFQIEETFESDGQGGRLGLYQVWKTV